MALPNGLDVPWGTEYVLEGHIVPRLREAEGPFGEFTGHYSGGRLGMVAGVKSVPVASRSPERARTGRLGASRHGIRPGP